MTDIVDPAIEAYAAAHTTSPPAYLHEVAEFTRSNMSSPGMMVGNLEGRFLELLVFATGATRILEIGTFTGYSSLSMAAGLAPGGKIVTCEVDPIHAEAAQRHIAASPYAGSIEVLVGPAIESIADLPGPFDLVFIDADKTTYLDYFEAVLPKLAPRGLILADNTLWHGQVVDPSDTSASTEALRAFNERVADDPRVVAVQTTVRDGVTLIRRADLRPVVDHAVADHVAVDHVAVDHVAVDHVAVDVVAVDHVAVDHVAVDHVAVDVATVS